MPFVVIGGHALNALGFSRHTGDLDLLVSLGSKSKWQNLLARLKYVENQSDDRFSRFSPTQIAAWPIDLMYTDDHTFAKLFAASQPKDFGLVCVPVIAPKHLILLKLHALKNYQEHRYAKDYGDLLFLLRQSQGKMSSEELLACCEKYASKALFDKVSKDLGSKHE